MPKLLQVFFLQVSLTIISFNVFDQLHWKLEDLNKFGIALAITMISMVIALGRKKDE